MINSIDYFNNEDRTVELIIVLNKPTKEVLFQVELIKKDFSKRFLITIIFINQCNLGLAYNEGIKKSKYSNILFLDTDLICEKHSIENMINILTDDIYLVKAKVVYNGMNKLVKAARKVNTTEVEPPYIPVILIKKSIFSQFKDDFLFAVDTVWCSDAEFANRVLKENIKIKYIDAEFYHDNITLKKDLKDAIIYGLGKGIRIKRTKERWKPIKEIYDMCKKSRNYSLDMLEIFYSLTWITIQQLACLFQKFSPNVFNNALPFEMSTKRSELSIEEV
ncbi:glycosyltransferase [Clostridioides difficile]|nr:glycosyltransferase [Clostridioides difficile]